MRRAIGEAHRRYTRRINFREKWRGYLWQGRFASFVMDEPYLLAAARYVELNPVRAGLVADAARVALEQREAHLVGRDDALVKVAPLLAMVGGLGCLAQQRAYPRRRFASFVLTVGRALRLGTRRSWIVWSRGRAERSVSRRQAAHPNY